MIKHNSIRYIVVFSFFLFTIIICYAHSMTGKFVYDDKTFIVKNYPVQAWLYECPWDYFLKPAQSVWTGIYRPIRTISFAIDYQLFGLNPVGFHIENILLHFINAILLFLILKRLLKSEKICFLATLLFIIHPIQTETVTWISSRADLLFTTGILSCFILFLRMLTKQSFSAKGLIGWSVVYCLSLLSKETAIAIVPTLFIFDVLFSYLMDSRRNMLKFLKERWVFYSLSGMATIVYLVVRFSLFENASQKPYWGGTAYANFLTMLDATVYYFRLIFLPLGLSIDYSTYPITKVFSFANPFIILDIIFYLSVFVFIAIRIYRKDYTFIFFVSFFILFLLPTWNILPISAIIAERFLYVPLIGIFCIIAIEWGKLFYLKKSVQALLVFFLCVLSSILIILTVYRNGDWQNDFTLWQSCAKCFPGNFKAHVNLGADYYDRGESLKALTENYKLLTLRSRYPTAFYNLGNIYWSLGLFKQSQNAFFKAIKLKPNYLEAYNNLGSLYIDKQWYSKAIKAFNKVLQINPNYARAHFNLGSLYFTGLKDYKKAYYHLMKALQYPEFRHSRKLFSMLEDIKEQKEIEDRTKRKKLREKKAD